VSETGAEEPDAGRGAGDERAGGHGGHDGDAEQVGDVVGAQGAALLGHQDQPVARRTAHGGQGGQCGVQGPLRTRQRPTAPARRPTSVLSSPGMARSVSMTTTLATGASRSAAAARSTFGGDLDRPGPSGASTPRTAAAAAGSDETRTVGASAVAAAKKARAAATAVVSCPPRAPVRVIVRVTGHPRRQRYRPGEVSAPGWTVSAGAGHLTIRLKRSGGRRAGFPTRRATGVHQGWDAPGARPCQS